MPTPYETVPPPYVKCFPEYLRAAGYYCTNNSKTDYQFAPPFTAWDECSTEAHWRDRPDTAQPFFAVFNPTVTHESGMWPKEDEALVTDPDAVELPPYLPDTPKARLALARQYDNIAAADRRVGELLDQLEADGLAENTIVFLWSDHGEGLPRGRRWPYDRGIRIPLIVRWPSVLEADSQNEQLVSLIDLGPTVLSLCGVQPPAHLQGRPFLGAGNQPREYIYASRDRHDEAYDMVRAVRDRRFKYIRNYHPELPYLLWNPYRNHHPVMQEMWRLYSQNKLQGPQKLMFEPRPPEELYDTRNDPFELNNLANDVEYRETLQRLRGVLDAWRRDVGDWGDVGEEQMVAQWWPGGAQPRTAAPIFVPINVENPGIEAAPEGGTFQAPLLVQLHCATQGASLGYSFEEGENPRWHLYTQPLRLPAGKTRVRAKAIRIGYVESKETEASFLVEDGGAKP
jgi:arylsulfatase A-like enzyme